ncbi:GH92 family glycosyl hydrolase [Sphingobacterium griseoflavum]|uniref:Alpha-1 2-mannosidase n=1 Tax=Sphingobacterium griseoflavum TaxID=1474952 RepID=A0ABQ3HU28_9SPHI|nr:GH92 family glycosyl hydrolase [Sphingobacterium griseoflavum]GHE34549.1 alpha-1 2-mannosidase [Sphingobacterium griseoflavum]
MKVSKTKRWAIALLGLGMLQTTIGLFAQQKESAKRSSLPAQAVHQQALDPVDYVNTLMGTDSKVSLSNGNTYPAVGLPWGMNMWTPQTGKMGDGWQYTYGSDKIRGIKQTHQPSPWMNDYGQFSLMPISGKAVFDQEKRASWFSHKSEVATPYYYGVYLADYHVMAEVTPTERASLFRFTFGSKDSAFVVFDAFDRGSEIQVIPEKNMLIGYSSRYSRGKLPNFKNYFIVVFDQPIDTYQIFDEGKQVAGSQVTGKHAGAVIGFKNKGAKQVVQARVSSSFISAEQAVLNLQELQHDGFEQIKAKGRAKWNEVLGKISIEGATDEQFRTFYSTLYRTVFFPNKLYEIDASGKPVHYSPYTGEVLPGYMFAGTGFWDTFRALYPLLNLLYPSINKEMQEGLLNCYKEGGFLPEWSSPGFADIMVGNNSASVVAEAYLKGARGYDIGTLYEALQHGANNEGPMTAVGRKGVAYYNTLGYVPYDVGINENAARTLEYAYDDFAIYRLAKALGRPKDEVKLYADRSQNYKKLFDPETKLMRGKNKDGQFQAPFNPLKWGDAFTEGNSWHYSWSVFHDVQGLIDLMGGDKVFVHMLDSVFSQAPTFDDSYYGGVIHEIREMQIANMGQYAHGNQPIQHMIYLYNYAGEPWKAQYWAREVLNRMYKPTPDGYCGDEDNGQTSAWYVFSALGFYPVCPAMDQYVMGAPLFKKATLHLENGKTFTIEAPKNSAQNLYVQDVKLNNKNFSKNWIGHQTIMDGGKLTVDMDAVPNKRRGVDKDAAPYSFTSDQDKY